MVAKSLEELNQIAAKSIGECCWVEDGDGGGKKLSWTLLWRRQKNEPKVIWSCSHSCETHKLRLWCSSYTPTFIPNTLMDYPTPTFPRCTMIVASTGTILIHSQHRRGFLVSSNLGWWAVRLEMAHRSSLLLHIHQQLSLSTSSRLQPCCGSFLCKFCAFCMYCTPMHSEFVSAHFE